MPTSSTPNGHPNTSTSSSNPASSIWSSPNIGQMTEMSHDWYKKMINDSAELIRFSLQPQYQQIDLASFITQSQPSIIPPLPQQEEGEETIFPFNSLPNLSDYDSSSFMCGALLFTPDQSGNSSILPTMESPIKESIAFDGTTANTSTSAYQPQQSRGRKYLNTNLLARFCQEVLQITAHPSLVQISEIVDRLKMSSSSTNNNNISEKKLRSSVREWFRKRREYMATKIYRSCKRLLPPCPFKTKESEKMTNFLRKVHANSDLIGIIMLESKLPMQSEREKLDFVKEKVTDFYLKYPQRKLRNRSSNNNIGTNQFTGDYIEYVDNFINE